MGIIIKLNFLKLIECLINYYITSKNFLVLLTSGLTIPNTAYSIPGVLVVLNPKDLKITNFSLIAFSKLALCLSWTFNLNLSDPSISRLLAFKFFFISSFTILTGIHR